MDTFHCTVVYLIPCMYTRQCRVTPFDFVHSAIVMPVLYSIPRFDMYTLVDYSQTKASTVNGEKDKFTMSCHKHRLKYITICILIFARFILTDFADAGFKFAVAGHCV